MENLKLPSYPVRSFVTQQQSTGSAASCNTEPGGGRWHLGRQRRQGKPRAAGGGSYYLSTTRLPLSRKASILATTPPIVRLPWSPGVPCALFWNQEPEMQSVPAPPPTDLALGLGEWQSLTALPSLWARGLCGNEMLYA
jgi:hypothetical protein